MLFSGLFFICYNLCFWYWSFQ